MIRRSVASTLLAGMMIATVAALAPSVGAHSTAFVDSKPYIAGGGDLPVRTVDVGLCAESLLEEDTEDALPGVGQVCFDMLDLECERSHCHAGGDPGTFSLKVQDSVSGRVGAFYRFLDRNGHTMAGGWFCDTLPSTDRPAGARVLMVTFDGPMTSALGCTTAVKGKVVLSVTP